MRDAVVIDVDLSDELDFKVRVVGTPRGLREFAANVRRLGDHANLARWPDGPECENHWYGPRGGFHEPNMLHDESFRVRFARLDHPRKPPDGGLFVLLKTTELRRKPKSVRSFPMVNFTPCPLRKIVLAERTPLQRLVVAIQLLDEDNPRIDFIGFPQALRDLATVSEELAAVNQDTPYHRLKGPEFWCLPSGVGLISHKSVSLLLGRLDDPRKKPDGGFLVHEAGRAKQLLVDAFTATREQRIANQENVGDWLTGDDENMCRSKYEKLISLGVDDISKRKLLGFR